MKAFDDFPELMMLHLIRNYRTQGFDKIPIKTSKDRLAFRSRLQNELSLRCLLMAAWHTAAPAIEVSILSPCRHSLWSGTDTRAGSVLKERSGFG